MQKQMLLMMQIVLLFILPGCITVIDWVKQEITQVDCCVSVKDLSSAFVRTIQCYDQFDLQAKFDILLLSKPIREYFVERHAYKNGLREEQKNIILKNEYEQEKHFISFYILSLYTVPLEKESKWNVLLSVNGVLYTHLEIKQVDDLPQEYHCLFGSTYNRFKTSYKVRFNAQDKDGNNIITDDTDCITIVFRSVDCQVSTSWDIT